MSSTTTNLGLTVYDDLDNPTVKSWRDTINKSIAQSAFGIIDAYAGSTDSRLDDLEESRQSYRIFATEVSSNNYVATNAEITALSEGLQILVSFDASNTDAVVLNINSLGNKTLYKVSFTGTAINLTAGDLIVNKIYTFEYQSGSFIKTDGATSSEILVSGGTAGKLLEVGSSGEIAASQVGTYGSKIDGDSINIGTMLTVDNHNIELPVMGSVVPGEYLGITVDAYGRITNAQAPAPPETGEAILKATDEVYSWSASAPDSDKLGGQLPAHYLTTAGKAYDSFRLGGTLAADYSLTTHHHDDNYLAIGGKAKDSDKLDGLDSTEFVQTSGNQTVGGIKTFTSIPVLPATSPTAPNEAVRKGYADATYINAITNQTVGGIKTFTSIPVLPATSPTAPNEAVRKGYADATYINAITHVTKNAVQAIPHDTTTKLSWSIVSRDDLVMWSYLAPTRLTVATAGYYDIFFYAQLAGSVSGTYSWSCLYVNNLIVHYAPPISVNQYGNQLTLNFRGEYDVNDYFEIGVNHNFGSSKNIVVSILPVFSAMRIG